MKDDNENLKAMKDSEILFFNYNHLSDDGKSNKQDFSVIGKHIRKKYLNKTRKISLDENQDFYDKFLSNLFEEEKTNCYSYITNNHKISPNNSNIKPYKKCKLKMKDQVSKDSNPRKSYSPHLNLNSIAEKVFSKNSKDKTEDKPKNQLNFRRINNILQPSTENKVHKMKKDVSKTIKNSQKEEMNINNYFKYQNYKSNHKEKQHFGFWNKLLCCLALQKKQSS